MPLSSPLQALTCTRGFRRTAGTGRCSSAEAFAASVASLSRRGITGYGSGGVAWCSSLCIPCPVIWSPMCSVPVLRGWGPRPAWLVGMRRWLNVPGGCRPSTGWLVLPCGVLALSPSGRLGQATPLRSSRVGCHPEGASGRLDPRGWVRALPPPPYRPVADATQAVGLVWCFV